MSQWPELEKQAEQLFRKRRDAEQAKREEAMREMLDRYNYFLLGEPIDDMATITGVLPCGTSEVKE